MAVTQYIGARYVPDFASPIEWNNTRTYDPLTITTHQGNSYTSRQFVPQGIDISNEMYWALTGNYNAQVEQYRKEVLEIASRFPMVYLTPEMFGAVGDGVADDSDAIIQCFRAAQAVNKPIITYNMVYKISKSIPVYTSVYGNSIFKINTITERPAELVQNNLWAAFYVFGSNIEIDGITVQCTSGAEKYNGNSIASATIISGVAITRDSKNVSIKNITVSEIPLHGIIWYSANAGSIVAENCIVTSGIGIYVEIPNTSLVECVIPKNIFIKSCYIKANFGFAIGQNENSVIENTIFETYESSTQYNVDIHRNDKETESLKNHPVFIGCTFDDRKIVSTANDNVVLEPKYASSDNLADIKATFINCEFKQSQQRVNANSNVSISSSTASFLNCKFNGMVETRNQPGTNSKYEIRNCEFNLTMPTAPTINADAGDKVSIYDTDFNYISHTATNNVIACDCAVFNCNFTGCNRAPLLANGNTVYAFNCHTNYSEIANMGTSIYTFHGNGNIVNGEQLCIQDGPQMLPNVNNSSITRLTKVKAGDIVFNTDLKQMMVYNGTVWAAI